MDYTTSALCKSWCDKLPSPHVDKFPCFSGISSYKSSYIIPLDAHKVYSEYQYSTSFAAYRTLRPI